ncbi:MAG: AraC family transcriptional regulator ligand-binding domain-containing protein, partial [Granulosicoccaceae bacterium]
MSQFKSPTAIPRVYAQMLVDASRQNGHNVDALLEYAGISQEQWRGGGDISAVHFGRLYLRMLWLMRDESFGMLTGDRVPNGSFRIMCLCAIQCRNLREAIVRVAEFCDVAIGYQTKPVLVDRGEQTLVQMAPTQHAQDRSSLNSREQLGRTRTLILMWHNFLSWLAGRS